MRVLSSGHSRGNSMDISKSGGGRSEWSLRKPIPASTLGVIVEKKPADRSRSILTLLSTADRESVNLVTLH